MVVPLRLTEKKSRFTNRMFCVPPVLTEASGVVKPEKDNALFATYGTTLQNPAHLTRTLLNMRGLHGVLYRTDYMAASKNEWLQNFFLLKHYTDYYDFKDINQAFEDSIKGNNMRRCKNELIIHPSLT